MGGEGEELGDSRGFLYGLLSPRVVNSLGGAGLGSMMLTGCLRSSF